MTITKISVKFPRAPEEMEEKNLVNFGSTEKWN